MNDATTAFGKILTPKVLSEKLSVLKKVKAEAYNLSERSTPPSHAASVICAITIRA
jgi:hypothetical protein